jgi:pyroglutamyl-peptidase
MSFILHYSSSPLTCPPCLQLMVHVGVSGIAKELTLEQQAHNSGYDKFDVVGCLPANGQCCYRDNYAALGDVCLVSGIRMGEVCEAVLNADECETAAVVSYDPGR